MPWAVATTGTNQAFSFIKKTIPANTDFTIRVVWSSEDRAGVYQLNETGGFNNALSFYFRKTQAYAVPDVYKSSLNFDGQGSTLIHINHIDFNEVHDWELKRVNGVVDLVDTQTQVSLLTSTVTNNNSFSFDSMYKYGNNVKSFVGEMQLIQITSIGNNYKWDASASDHSNTGEQPVLVDTISGNNAIGYGFLPDGSAWEKLGGTAETHGFIATISQVTILNSTLTKNSNVSADLQQSYQQQATKSKKIALNGEIKQSYVMQGFFQSSTTEVHQFNATIRITPVNIANFNKNVEQEAQISQSIVLTGHAIKRSALQLNIIQTTLLTSNAYKHVNVNAELQQNVVTNAIFFNAAQPLYLHKFRINGEIVFQQFNGATVKQRFNGALK